MKSLVLFLVLFTAQLFSAEMIPTYYMVTAEVIDEEVVFSSEDDFKEAMQAGFFRIKAPSDLNLKIGRDFAKSFTSNPRYNQFGVLDVVNGYLQSEIAQTVRFTLERDYWDQCHIDQRVVEGPPNYPIEIQKMGHRMNQIGVQILQSILRYYELPKDLWFEATGGAAHGEGSCFLLFNYYDPKLGLRDEGVGAHKDWGHISLLDVSGPGLEAKIDGVWRRLHVEEGYLIVNFDYPLEKLLPEVKASEHRVPTQREAIRTSTVVFIDPRVGLFREGVLSKSEEGYVYDWNQDRKELVNGESTIAFFTRLSNELYGENQE